MMLKILDIKYNGILNTRIHKTILGTKWNNTTIECDQFDLITLEPLHVSDHHQ
jgi:hypothetical protein